MNEQEIKDFINNNLLAKNEILEQFNVSSTTFDNYVRRSKIKPFIKKGPRVNLYLKSDMEQHFDSLERSTISLKTKVKLDKKRQIKKVIFDEKDISNKELQQMLNEIIDTQSKGVVSKNVISKTKAICDVAFDKTDINNEDLQRYIKALLLQKSIGVSEDELAKFANETSDTYKNLKTVNFREFIDNQNIEEFIKFTDMGVEQTLGLKEFLEYGNPNEHPIDKTKIDQSELSRIVKENGFEDALAFIKTKSFTSSNDEKQVFKNYKDFLGRSVTFTEFITEIKTYLRWNFADPKGEHLKITKSLIKENGFDNPNEFLDKYIFIKEMK